MRNSFSAYASLFAVAYSRGNISTAPENWPSSGNKKIFLEGAVVTAWLLSRLPGWLTGSAGSRAHREVKGWTKNNATLRTLRYGRFRRFLLRSADHPVVFAILVGFVSTGVACIATGQYWGDQVPQLPSPKLEEKFDPASFTGVPWSVQATLVALVYPIVLSLIALILQRRAHSTVALRVYVLDSAVIPAGASSIGLLLAMGLQYFASPYSTSSFLAKHMASLLVMNGTWFVANVFLTGFFLSRTVRFVQEEEQRHSYARVAVDVALRTELTAAVKQYIFVNAPYANWGFKAELSGSDSQPQVHMFASSDGGATVQRLFKSNVVLHDVHLHILKLAVRLWCKRASLQQKGLSQSAPTISFPAMVGRATTGQVVLCSVINGPSLTAFERMLIKGAFFFRPSREGTLSLSTKKMLEEVGVEVQAAAEQHRFGAAQEVLRNVVQLHKTLLLASAVDIQGTVKNAATIGTSPYAWGDGSFDIEWLAPYREIGSIAVAHLDKDLRLFRTMASIPAQIANTIPPRPEKLAIDAMLVGMNLMYHLAAWWTRRADASLVPGETSFNGILPAPLSKVYEQALIDFIGEWGNLHIRVSKSKTATPIEKWEILTARAKVYAKHIEDSAEMLVDAVSRGDEIASRWLLDHFLKWWGNRQYELRYGNLDDYQVRNVTLSLADKTLSEVQNFLQVGDAQVTVEMAGNALSLAIHRYWETIRLYVVLFLINNAGPNPEPDCRELRFASALIKGDALHSGGKTLCKPIDDVDSITTTLLQTMFGVETVERRLDKFADNLHKPRDLPVVAGWIYSWAGTPPELSEMKGAQATLLVALATQHSGRLGRNKKLIECWWRDLDKLQSVASYCQDLRREVLSNGFNASTLAVEALQTQLNKAGRVRSARLTLARTIKRLRQVALHERIITLRSLAVNEQVVRYLAERIAAQVFDLQHWPRCPVTDVRFVPELQATRQSMRFNDYKSSYVTSLSKQSDASYTKLLSQEVQRVMLAKAFHKRVADAGVTPVNDLRLRNNYEATTTERQKFITEVGDRCTSYRSAGVEPVVLVGQSALASFLQLHEWGPNFWQLPLPDDVTLRNGDANKGEELTEVFINDTPIYEFSTPNGDCYVVPSTMVKILELAGAGPSFALDVSWTSLGDEKLDFLVSWRAKFQ